jgi:hypothetical protein
MRIRGKFLTPPGKRRRLRKESNKQEAKVTIFVVKENEICKNPNKKTAISCGLEMAVLGLRMNP